MALSRQPLNPIIEVKLEFLEGVENRGDCSRKTVYEFNDSICTGEPRLYRRGDENRGEGGNSEEQRGGSGGKLHRTVNS